MRDLKQLKYNSCLRYITISVIRVYLYVYTMFYMNMIYDVALMRINYSDYSDNTKTFDLLLSRDISLLLSSRDVLLLSSSSRDVLLLI